VRLYVVLRYIGLVLVVLGLFMLASAGVSLLYRDAAVLVLVYSGLVSLLFGVFPMVFVPAAPRITATEGLVIVVGGWLLSCLFGALPYILWGGQFTLTNAWFESVSGFTTTGSSILIEVETLPHGLIFWRAATHWIGGLGILMFVLSVLPAMGMAGTAIVRTEISPLAQDNFRQNVKGIVRVLLVVYGGLTLVEMVALVAVGMNLFDAVTHSFATISTGGFSSRNLSVAAYGSPAIEAVLIVFMVLSGMHFGLLFATLIGGRTRLWESSVVRYYAAAMAGGVALVALMVHGQYGSWPDAFRFSAFQVVSVGTSTGFANADSSVWPPLAQILLMFLALQCACAGSTCGGIKADRIVLFAKGVWRQLRLLQHPRAVIPIRLDGKAVENDVLSAAVLYIGLYVLVVLTGGTLLTILGMDPLSAFSGAVATTGNVGPGLGSVGSLENFAHAPDMGKWILTGTMLLGRLEIYGFIMLGFPRIWRGAAKPGRARLLPRRAGG
jgi:trk system potassium uptake protein TrkH